MVKDYYFCLVYMEIEVGICGLPKTASYTRQEQECTTGPLIPIASPCYFTGNLTGVEAFRDTRFFRQRVLPHVKCL